MSVNGCERVFRVRPLLLKEIAAHDDAIRRAVDLETKSGTAAAIGEFLNAAALAVEGLDRAWCMDNLHEGQLVELAYLPRRAAQVSRELRKNSDSPSASVK